jgi:outer membrane receptor protein involved in Fe transport
VIRATTVPAGLRLGTVVALFLIALVTARAGAGTMGKVSGVVRDAKQQPLAGVNVALIGVPLGAISDLEGRYTILNVPAGTYSIKASLIGHQTTTVTGLSIPADRTTTQDFSLKEEAVALEEVVVSARRPVVELGLTSNIATVTRAEIAKLPVQELAELVELQAGVVDGHFRGGRIGEVQYQVDGVSVNNPYDNKSSLKLDRSVLEEVQVISGTFDAEYGHAMSGVVNSVLRRGQQNFEWSGEMFGGDFYFPGSTRPQEYDPAPGSLRNFQLSLSGPAGLPKTLFLLNGRLGGNDGPSYAERRFLPTDRSSPDSNIYRPTGDDDKIPLGYTREWQALGKLTNRSLPGELSYQVITNRIEGRRNTWAYRLNPEGLSQQNTWAVVHGFDWTHALNPKTFYRLNVRQNYFDYQDMLYADVFDKRYDAAGPAVNDEGYELDAFIQGADWTRFVQVTNALVLGGSFTRHFAPDHQMKAGVEWQPTYLKFGTPGHLVDSSGTVIRKLHEPPDYFKPQEYRPVVGTVYAQDEVEWNDLRLRAGLRFEYFAPKLGVPSDPRNPANSIEGAPQSELVAATRKVTLSPRLGVSYPVTPKSSLFFAYGHFYQMAPLGQIYDNANYDVLANLQASGGRDFGVLGNPDVKPERTVQYQFGFRQEIKEWLGLDLSLFYKDIRDLLGTEIVTTYNNAEYKRLTNADFGNVIGMTIALDQRAAGPVSSTLDYTWQVAKGNSSDPYETAARVDAQEDPRPRQVYLNWDQRHTLNLTLTVAHPTSYYVSTVLRYGSGQPYTPEIDPSFGGELESNSGRKPASTVVDIRGEKYLGGRPTRWSLFARILNVFDSRYDNGYVFASSGSPYYSRVPTYGDQITLSDPSTYAAPRRIEIGVGWSGASR